MRKLTRQTIKPVLHYTRVNVNSGFYKFYHFTLDTYNGNNSFQGGTAYTLGDCYQYNGEPLDAYAVNLETGDVIDLKTRGTVFTTTL